MDNKSRIQANNAKLRECIETAESLPEVGASFPTYEGDYNITPTFKKQTLPTDNRLLTDSLSVEAIPVVKVSNESGGNTIIIGG